MKAIIVIRRTADGLERTVEDEWPDQMPGGDGPTRFETVEYQWTDGNMGCDCNMGDQFARAAGELDPEPAYPCTGSEFELVSIEFGGRKEVYA